MAAMGSTADQELIAENIEAYLTQYQYKSLLRFITCGSVGDGKSTLIGRLLCETHLVFEDHLAALEVDSAKVGTQGGDLDFALLLDGLSAEREQGITIDVAYRFFSTERRKFIVADTPATSSTHATWSPAPPPPTSRSSWSMPAKGCSPRPAATACSCRCSASNWWWWPSTRWT